MVFFVSKYMKEVGLVLFTIDKKVWSVGEYDNILHHNFKMLPLYLAKCESW